jgi:hypothetical protein
MCCLFVNFGSGQRQVSLTTTTAMATAMMAAMATATATVAATTSGTFPQPPPLSPFHYLIVVCLIWASALLCSFPFPTIFPLSPRLTFPPLYCPPNPPLPVIYHHKRLIVKYFIISFFFCRCVSQPVLSMGWALSCSFSPPLSSPSPIASFPTPLLHTTSNRPTIVS